VWVELGLRVPDWPEITIRYSHEFRQGMKDSTIWGDTTLTGLAVQPTRKIVPSFRDIDETRDIFSFEASKTIGNTDVMLGMRYEHNDNDDSLSMERNAGQIGVAPSGQRWATQRQVDNVDLFSGHGITESRITDNLWFTTGYSYTTLENDLSGTRIFGTHFDSAFGEPVPTLGQRVFSRRGTRAQHAAVYPNESGPRISLRTSGTGIWRKIVGLRSFRRETGAALHRYR